MENSFFEQRLLRSITPVSISKENLPPKTKLRCAQTEQFYIIVYYHMCYIFNVIIYVYIFIYLYIYIYIYIYIYVYIYIIYMCVYVNRVIYE